MVTVDQMREVDRLMISQAGISLVQMMENAGRATAVVARESIGGTVTGRRVAVMAGTGGNGGGGLVAARRLACWGATVAVWLARPQQDYSGVPAQQLAAAVAAGVHVRVGPPGEADLQGMHAVVDAVIGYSLAGPPHGVAAGLIEAVCAAAEEGLPVVALDVPSGLDADTGHAPGPAVRASHTVTLALPKVGLLVPEAARYVGAVSLADISVPSWVYTAVGIDPGEPFRTSDLVRLW